MSVLGDVVTIGGGGETASIWLTGVVQSTDVVTATKGSKTVNGAWTSIPNPAAHGLPSGYTEVEYIESTGTQYIDTGIVATQAINSKILFEYVSFNNSYNRVFGTTGVGGSPYGVRTSNSDSGVFHIEDIGSLDSNVTPIIGNKYLIELRDRIAYINDAQVGSFTAQSGGTQNIYLFCHNQSSSGTPTESSNIRVYYYVMSNSSTTIHHFIPCIRTSDSAVGMYDLVSNTFFGNSGTGSFTAGAVVPATFTGFLCDKIDDYGTWTVTASRSGTAYYTANVLVDAAERFDLTYSSRLYLYNDGDECTTITGGWIIRHYQSTSSSSTYGIKETSDISLCSYWRYGYYSNLYWAETSRTVDVTNYGKLCGTVSGLSTSLSGMRILAISNQQSMHDEGMPSGWTGIITPNAGTYEFDLSSFSGSYYIKMMAQIVYASVGSSYTNKAKFHKVWLE